MTTPNTAAPGDPVALGTAVPVTPTVPVAAPVAAPVVAPVTPVVPAVEAEAAKPVLPTLDTPKADVSAISYDPTGDAGLDVALNFVGSLGIAEDHPAMVAAATGDFSILEAFLKTNPAAKGWEPFIELGKQALSRRQGAAEDTARQVVSVVHEVAGSAEQWNAIQTWAAANAEPAEKEAINAMFAAGPVQARAAAGMLAAAYAAASGTTIEPASASVANSSRPAPNAGTPLTPKEFAREADTLRRRLGRGFEQSDEYAALWSRTKK